EQGFVWQVNLPALTESLEHLGKSPLEDQHRYLAPAFFVRGMNSDFVRTEDFDLIHKHFPAARIESIEGAGHNPHIEKREEFVAIVREFLEREA
ncbi:MAG: alpha/beta hydrolase, partial [Opitutales bacterium]